MVKNSHWFTPSNKVNLFLLSIKDLTMKCNEEEKSLSPEAFSKVSLTNLRRSAIPDLSSDLGMNIFKKVSRTTLKKEKNSNNKKK